MTTPPSAEYMTRAVWKQAMLASLNVIVAVLAVRLILLVAVVGGIGLSYLALQDPNPYRLGVLAIFVAGVLIPTAWLSAAAR